MHKICFTISFISRLYIFRAHVLIVKQILCVKLVKYQDKYTEMHGQQKVKKSRKHVVRMLLRTLVCNLHVKTSFL
jgi:hypothetical protein